MKIESYKVRGETKYRFRAYICLDPVTGEPVRVQRSGFDSKREAQLAAAEIIAKAEPAKAKNITYCEIYELWLESYRLSVKESTLRHTEQIFRDHILPAFSSMRVQDITPLQCQQWTTAQVKKDPAAAGRRFNYFSKVLDFAFKQGVIDKNPALMIDRPKKSKSGRSAKAGMNFYTKEELEQFLHLCEERLPLQWYVFFRLLAYSGLRRGEAIALKWEDIDFRKRTIRITKTVTHGEQGAYISDTPKTDKSNRVIMLDDKTLQLIHSLKCKSEYVFPNSKGSFTTPSMVIRMMHRAVDGTDLRYISPHGLRHTHCSLLFSAGVSIPEVQDRLGHTDVKTTIDVYNHVYQSDKAEALNRFLAFMGE
ncbi:tyrosine-type recombinase/integrase [Mobilibacterium timonense]|uniref:tyrosine-type recombinase/integrase n=1 Tax=Mobilibacterium timonense TaxID=1871012 RepID=UPI000986DA3C|nr:site-specific integrase [Mobilibacterium timonense]